MKRKLRMGLILFFIAAALYTVFSALTTAILVSDPLHMKRAMLMAGDCGMEAFSSPTPTSRYISLKTKLPFLARETFFYVGYQVYRIFH